MKNKKYFKKLIVILISCVALFPTLTILARDTETGSPSVDLTWVRTGGPLGGLGYDIRMRPDNPDIMYVTDAYAGVHMSTDGGQTWFPSNEGIIIRDGPSGDAIPIFCLTIDPHNHDIVWAGTSSGIGVYKSMDGGYSWVNMANNILDEFPNGLTFRGFTVDPRSSDIVYLAAEVHNWAGGGEFLQGREFEKVGGILYKTTDGGQRWEAVWRGDSLARYIWIDPRDPQVLYLSTGIFDREAANSDHASNTPGGEGVLKSSDGGQTWEHINNGLTNLYIGTLFMHPEDPDILLAASANNAYHEGGGTFLTENGGETWEMVAPFEANSVEFSTANPDIAYAGNAIFIFRSEDRGRTWQIITDPEYQWGAPGVVAGFPIDFQVDPRDENRIFANNYGGGNFLSEDGGRTWTTASNGYTGALMKDIAVSPDDPASVYASAGSGLFVSPNGGTQWFGLNDEDLRLGGWHGLAIDPANAAHLLAASVALPAIVQSFDGGLTWETTTWDLWEKELRGIEFAPSDSQRVYAYSESVFVSRDGGTNWEPAIDDLSGNFYINDLAIHPQNPDIVFAAVMDRGLLKSTDGGESWTEAIQTSGFHRFVRSVAFHPANPERIYTGIGGDGLYVSDDGGETWNALVAGLNIGIDIIEIIFDPTDPEVMYVAGEFSGVFGSMDGGQTWQPLQEGLRTRAVAGMDISSDGQHLYAATNGEGVFRLDLNGQPP